MKERFSKILLRNTELNILNHCKRKKEKRKRWRNQQYVNRRILNWESLVEMTNFSIDQSKLK